MKLCVCKNYDEMSRRAAETVSRVVREKPNCILGLATGSTPLGMYRCLVDMSRNGLDFSEVRTYNLDEYYPIKPTNPQSYRYFMDHNLFGQIGIDPDNTHLLNGEASDPAAECAAYDAAIEADGGIDLQVLGIGGNGHIGFNEPAEGLICETHLTALAESTIEANSRFFQSSAEVPRHALTMGIQSIMRARRIILLASGQNKRDAITGLLNGRITTSLPATLLLLHPDVTVFCDEEAYRG